MRWCSLARRALVAVVLALFAVGLVVVYDADRSDATFTIVSGPPDPIAPMVIPRAPTVYEVVASPVKGAGRLFLEVGTYLERPKDTIVLAVLGARGRRIARCVFPPSAYSDNEQLPCPLRDISRARALRVTRRGTAKIALYGHDEQAGFLVKNEATSFAGRVSTVLSRVAVPLPNGVGSSVLLVALFGSVALAALGLLLAVGTPETSGSGDDGELGPDDDERATASTPRDGA